MHQMVLLETIPSLRKAKKSLPKRWWAKDPARRITYFTIYTIILGKKVEEEEIQHEVRKINCRSDRSGGEQRHWSNYCYAEHNVRIFYENLEISGEFISSRLKLICSHC